MPAETSYAAEPAPAAVIPVATLATLAAEALARLVPPSLADRPEFAALARAPDASRAAWAGLRAAPAACDRALVSLALRCGFDDLDLLAVTIARAVELDPLWSRAVAALQDTPQAGRPTVGLLARAFAALSNEAHRVPQFVVQLLHGAALQSGVLQLAAADQPAAECSLTLRAQLLPLLAPFAADAAALPAAVVFGGCRLQRLEPPDWPLPRSWIAALGHHAGLLMSGAATGATAIGQLVLRANAVSEANALAAALGRLLQRPVVQVSRSEGDGPLPPGAETWCLAQGALALFVFDLAPGEQACVPPLARLPGPVLVAMSPEGDVVPSAQGVTLQWRIERPPALEREALWRAALGPAGAALDHGLLARRYCSGVSTLHAAAAAALARAAAEAGPLRERHVAAAMCEDLVATTHGLSALAQWLPCHGTDAAFVGDGGLRDELALVLARCQWREHAGSVLGPAIAARANAGVRLLFIGPSGTGKTLAAQWLAEQLGKPLFRVDIAAVSSKYIGETEKNLAQLLARAEQLDCVLLFDEADSMFGARTEINQANDRHANAQTNYLLQRIESFSGITALTSNNRARFDDAFMRRLDHVVEFPLPRGAARAALWNRHLGTAHRLTEMELARLAAEIDLPGGHLRNIVLAALLHATLEGGAPGRVPIGYGHVLQAAALEYSKLGRRLPDALGSGAVGGR